MVLLVEENTGFWEISCGRSHSIATFFDKVFPIEDCVGGKSESSKSFVGLMTLIGDFLVDFFKVLVDEKCVKIGLGDSNLGKFRGATFDVTLLFGKM